jgi:hypothetical protein
MKWKDIDDFIGEFAKIIATVIFLCVIFYFGYRYDIEVAKQGAKEAIEETKK